MWLATHDAGGNSQYRNWLCWTVVSSIPLVCHNLAGDHLSLWPLLPNKSAKRTYKDPYGLLPRSHKLTRKSQLEFPHELN